MTRAVWAERAVAAVGEWEQRFGGPVGHRALEVDPDRLERAWGEFTRRMAANYPFFHPRFAGQMLKPPHPVAVAGYLAAMLVNPNNHALDGGPVTSAMEREVVADLAAMFHLPVGSLGHLTSSGTVANLEALWVARELHPGRAVVHGTNAHYTHGRMCQVLGLPAVVVGTDERGHLDLDAVEDACRRHDVGTVVLTVGATGLGTVDDVHEALALRERYGVRLHVDAAYGGFFSLLAWDEPSAASVPAAALRAIAECDSVVVDPHKHGLQPYGCGSVLFADPAVGRLYRHDSPYTYFTSDELHLGEISLECSRAGASAVALWATQRLLPLMRGGEFAAMLEDCRAAALDLHQRLSAADAFVAPIPPELDIVVWAVRGASVAESSERARKIFDAAARRDLHLALVQLPVAMFPGVWPEAPEADTVTCLRSVLMKPEHRAWMDQIWQRLSAAAQEILPSSSTK